MNLTVKYSIILGLLIMILAFGRLYHFYAGYTMGFLGWLDIIYTSYRDLLVISFYVSVLFISLFFVIYSLFPPSVLTSPKEWTPLRKLALSLSSYITLGRGDIHVLDPFMQIIMAIEGFIGFLFIIFIGSRMVLVGKPILSAQDIKEKENIIQDDEILFNEIDTSKSGKISFAEFHKAMKRSRARQGIHESEYKQLQFDKNLFNRMDADDNNQDGVVRFPEFHKELMLERKKPMDLRMLAAGHLSAAKGDKHLTYVPHIEAKPIDTKYHTTHHSNK